MATADPREDILDILEVALHDLGDTGKDEARALVEQAATHLARTCDGIVRLRVGIERPQRSQVAGNPWKVRVEATARGHVDCVAVSEPGDHDARATLRRVVKDTFRAVERQLHDQRAKQRAEVKRLVKGDVPEATEGLVAVVYREEGYGFLSALDGREVYFHENAVLDGRFGELRPGVRVRFEDELGDKGPQATFVQVLGPIPRPETGEAESGLRRPGP